MLKYGAASELHAPPRVLESHQPLSSLPPSPALIGNGFWQVRFARLNIKQNGKKMKNVSKAWMMLVQRLETVVSAKCNIYSLFPSLFASMYRYISWPMFVFSSNNTYNISLLSLRCLRVTISKLSIEIDLQ